MILYFSWLRRETSSVAIMKRGHGLVFILILTFQLTLGSEFSVPFPSNFVLSQKPLAEKVEEVVEKVEEVVEKVEEVVEKVDALEEDVEHLKTPECPCQEHVVIDDWTLVYRMVSQAGGPTYLRYMEDELFHDPKTVPPGCLTLDSNEACDLHFKSCILPHWQNLNIEQAKVVIIKDNVVKQELMFNATGSSKLTWFARHRVLSSTWTDIDNKTPKSIFSIEGTSTQRRWYIHADPFQGGCPADASNLLVLDDYTPGLCPYEHPSQLPLIYYSPLPTKSIPTEWALADLFVVMVKFGET